MSLPDGITVRPASVGDTEASTDCHMTCWAEAYGPLADPDRLAAKLADRVGWVARTRDHLAGGGPPRWLAWHGGRVVGLASAGPSRDPDAGVPEELMALYVRAAWHGTGIGSHLLDQALGERPCWLWVLEDNARAIAFYTRHGFRPDGGRQLYEGLGTWELRLVRS